MKNQIGSFEGIGLVFIWCLLKNERKLFELTKTGEQFGRLGMEIKVNLQPLQMDLLKIFE